MAIRYTDISNKNVRIWHAIKQMDKGFTPLKNASSVRVITLIDSLYEELKPIINSCNKDSPFIFGGETCLSMTAINFHFKNAIKKSGVKPIRLHDLRHSFVTNAINNSAPVIAISKYIGHASITQTLQTYSHVLEETNDKLLDIMQTLSANEIANETENLTNC